MSNKHKYKYSIYIWSTEIPITIETDEENINELLEQNKVFINDNISKITRQKFPLNKNEIEIITDYIEPEY